MTLAIEPATFRRILGHYPTGVCAITAMPPDGRPAAMIVGSFTSVSLDPALVAFFPDKASSSWPRIAEAGRFCVNVLGDDQEALCRTLASKDPDKFAGVAHRPSALGSPVLDGAIAWIDCTIYAVHDAGDHHLVLGSVHALDVHHSGAPLLFHRGTYGKLAPPPCSRT